MTVAPEAAWLLAQHRRRPAVRVAVAVVAAADRSLQRPDWRYVARALGPGPTQGPGPTHAVGRAILIQHYRTLLPLSLYRPHLHVLGPAGPRVDQLDVISMSSPRQPLCWWGAACNPVPSRMQRRYAIRGFRGDWTRHVLQFEIKRLVARRPVTLTPADVSRALDVTRLRRDVLELQLG
ncbi:MAG TPA: hypothetical protein VHV28_01620 [Solirubrobacteraceae bacterium]|nr:hypothetical protein [Solirubrobacteraceae bacterium]